MLRASMTIAAALPSWVRSGSQIHMPLPSGSGEPGVPLGPPARSVTGGAGLGVGLGAGAAGAAGAVRVAARPRTGAGDAATCQCRGHGAGAGTPAVLAGSAAAAATTAPPVRPRVRAVLMPPTRRPPTANPARNCRAPAAVRSRHTRPTIRRPPVDPAAGPNYPSKGSESDAERMGTI